MEAGSGAAVFTPTPAHVSFNHREQESRLAVVRRPRARREGVRMPGVPPCPGRGGEWSWGVEAGGAGSPSSSQARGSGGLALG